MKKGGRESERERKIDGNARGGGGEEDGREKKQQSERS
jgi:hypothetical protein